MRKSPNLDLDIGLSDKQIQFSESLKEFDITGYGGAKGGGKSGGARNVALSETLTTPGLVTVLFRRTYPELKDNHLDKLFSEFPGLRGYYNGSEHEIRIPELESYFKFRHCKTMSDVQSWAGREIHRVLIEEAGDWPYDMAFKLIRNTMRSTVPGIKASAGMLFNWGGVGHGWQKRIFWDKRLRPEEKNFSFNFILAKVEDNPWIMQHDPGYLQRLESEPNLALRRAHRDGDPNIIAGAFFDFRHDIHVVKPFAIPKHWKWFGSHDHGFNHPGVWGFWATDEDGNVYFVKEIYKAGMYLDEQHAQVVEIAKKLEIPLPVFHAGLDCWAVRKPTTRDATPTIAEEFVKMKPGLILQRANVARILGAAQCREYLRYEQLPDGKITRPPRVFVFESCEHTIGCLQRMQVDPDNQEDVLKVDSSGGDVETGDDGYDNFRYGLMSRPLLAQKPKEPKLDRYKIKTEVSNSWTVA